MKKREGFIGALNVGGEPASVVFIKQPHSPLVSPIEWALKAKTDCTKIRVTGMKLNNMLDCSSNMCEWIEMRMLEFVNGFYVLEFNFSKNKIVSDTESIAFEIVALTDYFNINKASREINHTRIFDAEYILKKRNEYRHCLVPPMSDDIFVISGGAPVDI